MCYSYLMMKRTCAVPSYIIKGGELITVNNLDGEKIYFRTRHDGRVDMSDTYNLLLEPCAIVEELYNISKCLESLFSDYISDLPSKRRHRRKNNIKMNLNKM